MKLGAIGLLAALAWPLRAAAADPALPAYEPRAIASPKSASYLTPAGAISVVGYNDMAEMLQALGLRFAALHPHIRFAWDLPGTKAAPAALASGKSAFAPTGAEFSSRELADYRVATGGEPLLFRVAHASLDPRALSGPLAIFVDKENPLASLTLDEAAAIFARGATRGLHPCGLAPETALGRFMLHALGAKAFGAEFAGFPQSADVVKRVGEDRNAIGFAAAMRATPAVKILTLASRAGEPPVALTNENLIADRYPLDRHLFIYARQPLEPVAREFLRFALSREGQQIIASGTLGYLPLSASAAAAERAKLGQP